MPQLWQMLLIWFGKNSELDELGKKKDWGLNSENFLWAQIGQVFSFIVFLIEFDNYVLQVELTDQMLKYDLFLTEV